MATKKLNKSNPLVAKAMGAISSAAPATASAFTTIFKTYILPILPALISEGLAKQKDKPKVKAVLVQVQATLNEWYPAEESEE